MASQPSLKNIVVKKNEHGRSAYLRGQEWGGGPYEIVVDWLYVPVSVKKIPAWATDWHDVFRVLRAVVGAFEFDDDAETTSEAYDEIRRLWQDAQARARRGVQVRDLTLLKPQSAPKVPISWSIEATDARGNVTERRGRIARALGLRLEIIDTLNRRERYEVWQIVNGERPYMTRTGMRFKTLAELQAYLRDVIALNQRKS